MPEPAVAVAQLEALATRNSRQTLRRYNQAKGAYSLTNPGHDFDQLLSQSLLDFIALLQQRAAHAAQPNVKLKLRLSRKWKISLAEVDTAFDSTTSVRLLKTLCCIARAADFASTLAHLRTARDKRVRGERGGRVTRKPGFTGDDATQALAEIVAARAESDGLDASDAPSASSPSRSSSASSSGDSAHEHGIDGMNPQHSGGEVPRRPASSPLSDHQALGKLQFGHGQVSEDESSDHEESIEICRRALPSSPEDEPQFPGEGSTFSDEDEPQFPDEGSTFSELKDDPRLPGEDSTFSELKDEPQLPAKGSTFREDRRRTNNPLPDDALHMAQNSPAYAPRRQTLTDEDRIRSLESLRPDTWLDDNVVNYTVHLICAAHSSSWMPANSFLPGSSSSRTIAIEAPTQAVILPLNLQSNHWAIAIYDIPQRRVNFFNSLRTPAYTREAQDTIRTFAAHQLQPQLEWTFCECACPQQTNGHDCGVYALAVLMLASAGVALPATIDASQWRKLLSHIIGGEAAADGNGDVGLEEGVDCGAVLARADGRGLLADRVVTLDELESAADSMGGLVNSARTNTQRQIDRNDEQMRSAEDMAAVLRIVHSRMLSPVIIAHQVEELTNDVAAYQAMLENHRLLITRKRKVDFADGSAQAEMEKLDSQRRFLAWKEETLQGLGWEAWLAAVERVRQQARARKDALSGKMERLQRVASKQVAPNTN